MILGKAISIKELSEIHATFTRFIKQTLLREIKVLVQVHTSIDQLDTNKFINSFPQETNQVYFHLTDAMASNSSEKLSLTMMFSHEFLYGLIDKLTGGPAMKSAIPKNKKDLTKLEITMITKLAQEFVEHLELSLQPFFGEKKLHSKLVTTKDFLASEIGASHVVVIHHLVEFAEIKGDILVIYPDKSKAKHSLRLT